MFDPMQKSKNPRTNKVFENKKQDYYNLVAEDNINIHLKDMQASNISHVEMMSKDVLRKEDTFKHLINNKFDSKIEKFLKKYNILSTGLSEEQINKLKSMQQYVDPSSIPSKDDNRWVNRFCKNNGIKLNVQLIKLEKKQLEAKKKNLSKSNLIEDEIHFVDCNNQIAKMT